MLDILHDYGVLLLIGQYPAGPIGGVAMTLLMAVSALAISFPVAIFVALARRSSINLIYRVAAGYIFCVRGIPVMLIIFWAYFFLPLVTGVKVTGPVTVVCALVVYEGAYLAESIRGAIAALPKGQTEAARALGLGYWKAQYLVILPQALVNAIPSIMNQFVLIVKNTALAYLIGTQEVTFSANQINAQLLTEPFQVYVILAGIYFLICFSLARVATALENRIKRRRSGTGKLKAPGNGPERADHSVTGSST
ncbi:amino acid ABC transporter permease [Paraburkholderia nemoris]|uniref:amino acid ABC transporter permease n=1 Tax=Paraburkholderia nemoris TaxID=2793076 RepID=UPI001B1741A8|nr:amino acid ABC transporter permease [Paraburkholderia nemoris]CAE6851164.1 Inner membrane amino-acid ABC transporter permease protein YhdY [Paraburkholderia nemoris]